MTLNTYELTSLNADLLLQNNLYSQVTNRQVPIQGSEKTEQSRLVFYFDYIFWCLITMKEHTCIKTLLLMQWMMLLLVYYFTFVVMHT